MIDITRERKKGFRPLTTQGLAMADLMEISLGSAYVCAQRAGMVDGGLNPFLPCIIPYPCLTRSTEAPKDIFRGFSISF